MYNIQTLNKISPLGTDIFDREKYNITDKPDNAAGILVRSASMHDMDFPNELLAIARAGAGVNNIPLDRCSEAGICVFNTPGANANAVKELVIAGLLLASRKIPEAMAWVNSVKDNADVPKLIEQKKSDFTGPEISGKTLGVVGLGAIGTLVANTALHLGMNVIGTDPFLSVDSALKITPKLKFANSIDELYKESDYISFHLPYTPATKSIVNASAMRIMKKGVRILNFARGELVNDTDIIEALNDGTVARYVTDFPNSSLIGVPNVVSIPHLGASTPESEDNCAVMASNQLIEYIETGNIKNSVNLPDAEMNAAGTKICIIHKNKPTIISKITGEIASRGLNIENMLNKSKKDYAYTLIDAAEGSASPAIIDAIRNTDGIIRVRVIS